MNPALKKVLSLCEEHAFLKPVWESGRVCYYKFGPAGEFLVNNIRSEWVYSSVTSREENIYPFHSGMTRTSDCLVDLQEPFNYVKNLNSGQLPFGLAEMRSEYKCEEQTEDSVLNLFRPGRQGILRSFMFVSPSEARQFFYSWQRQRKMWWRKFSVSPGRFSLSDIKELEICDSSTGKKGGSDAVESLQSVSICANFDYGSPSVETVYLRPPGTFHGVSTEQIPDFKARDGRKTVLPCLIESVTSAETASLVFLCDAFSEPQPERQLLRLHRRLAPYKASFSASSVSASVGDKLRDLAQHLSGVLRRAGLSTLLLPDIARKSLESQLTRSDEMGIPFTVILSDTTLTDGILRLYSRETSLKEQVHVSQLANYMERLMKN